MCGIVGAVAQRNIVSVLVEGLRRLEYRGYDSCGVAVLSNGEPRRARSVARVSDLDAQVASGAVTPEEAEGLRTEIRKRLLAEDRQVVTAKPPLAPSSYGRIALGLAAIDETNNDFRT